MSLELKLIALAVAALALLGGWEYQKYEWTQAGVAQCQAVTAAAVAKQTADADAKTETMKENAHVLALANAVQNSSIDTRLAADLVRLRSRPASASGVPQAASSAAADGSDGGLLERNRNLLGLGARANKLRAKLAECQAWIGAMTQ